MPHMILNKDVLFIIVSSSVVKARNVTTRIQGTNSKVYSVPFALVETKSLESSERGFLG